MNPTNGLIAAALAAIAGGKAPADSRRTEPVWTGRKRPRRRGGITLHPRVVGKTMHAPDGYLFNARGDLVSKKKIAKRARRAQERAQ